MNGVLPHSQSANGSLNGSSQSTPGSPVVNSPGLTASDRSPVLDPRLLHRSENKVVHASDITFSSVRGTRSTRSATDQLDSGHQGLAHVGSGNALNTAVPEEDEDELTEEQKLSLSSKNPKSMTSSDVKALQREKMMAEVKAKREAEKKALAERKKKEDAERAAQLEKTIMLAGTKL
jgi:hypothetical protein